MITSKSISTQNIPYQIETEIDAELFNIGSNKGHLFNTCHYTCMTQPSGWPDGLGAWATKIFST